MTRVLFSLILATSAIPIAAQTPAPPVASSVASRPLTDIEKQKMLRKRDQRETEAIRHAAIDQPLIDAQNALITQICRSLHIPDEKIASECFVDLTPPACNGKSEDECAAVVSWKKPTPPAEAAKPQPAATPQN